MNQQLIDQLVKLATIRVNNPLVNSDGKVILDDWEEGVSMSKLIELTVRECIDISKQAEKQCQHPGTMMKTHFGVE